MSQEWILEETESINFGDKRLNKRLGDLLEVLSNSPNQGIPKACGGWKETIAAYRFFGQDKVTIEKILLPHKKATLGRIEKEPVVLIVQDTSEIDYSHRKPVKGLGPLRTERSQGFHLHTSLAITPDRRCLGVVDAKMRSREKQGCNKRREQRIEEKESYRWIEGYRLANEIAEKSPESMVINVADREADIYELLMEKTEIEERKAHWLIRSQHNRRIMNEKDKEIKEKLHMKLRDSPVAGEVEFILPRASSRPDKKDIWKKLPERKSRKVRQAMRIMRVKLAPAEGKGMHLPSVHVYAIHCEEIDVPKGEEKIEWFLLTSYPTETVEEALRVVEWYLCRWQIEVFFKILKCGCRIEELQFDCLSNMSKCIAVYMIVAWRVLYLMMLGRNCGEMDCSVYFEESEWQSTYVIVTGEAPPERPPQLNEMIKMVAKLGGFLGRKSDGEPGPQVIWIGLQRMRDFALAWGMFSGLQRKTYV
jgi:hypothetical protein